MWNDSRESNGHDRTREPIYSIHCNPGMFDVPKNFQPKGFRAATHELVHLTSYSQTLHGTDIFIYLGVVRLEGLVGAAVRPGSPREVVSWDYDPQQNLPGPDFKIFKSSRKWDMDLLTY